jgi:hypothetical protein
VTKVLDTLTELRGTTEINTVVTEVLLEGVPWIFAGDRRAFTTWKAILASMLEVDSHSLIIVGSAATGVSLNPHKNLRPFHGRSDVDVAAVSPRHFDEAWRSLRALGADRYSLSAAAKEALRMHEHLYVFWGTIATDRILGRLPFGKTWYPALLQMARIDPTSGRSVKVRLYRDIEALRDYQVRSMSRARTALAAGS